MPKERDDLRLARLGMEMDHLKMFAGWLHEPHGIVLVTGPTGSGKSTTLYAALEEINDRVQKIITVEDPVEYVVPGVTQIQTHAEIGYDFARALRAILRQDPDIIMIGEIRDRETAEIAVQSALTGHLVLSTLHTNDAVSAFARLTDMGVESFLLASAVRAVMAQRLVRKLCEKCSIPTAPPDALRQLVDAIAARQPSLFGSPENWRSPKGCPNCNSTGYRGRVGIYEMIEVSGDLQESIMRHDSSSRLVEISRRSYYRNLREDGLLKARTGITSVEEVLRVSGLSGD
jgi:general secretion pathway protein E